MARGILSLPIHPAALYRAAPGARTTGGRPSVGPAVGSGPMPVATSRQHPRGVRTDPETSAERRIVRRKGSSFEDCSPVFAMVFGGYMAASSRGKGRSGCRRKVFLKSQRHPGAIRSASH